MSIFDFGEYVPGSERERAELLQVGEHMDDIFEGINERVCRQIGNHVNLRINPKNVEKSSNLLVAEVGPVAIRGFGAMLRRTKEVSEIFPEGAIFSLWRGGANTSVVLELASHTGDVLVYGTAMGNRDGQPVQPELHVHIKGRSPEVNPMAAGVLFTPEFLVDAGCYLTRAAENPNH